MTSNDLDDTIFSIEAKQLLTPLLLNIAKFKDAAHKYNQPQWIQDDVHRIQQLLKHIDIVI